MWRATNSDTVGALVLACAAALGGCGGAPAGRPPDAANNCPYIPVTLDPVADAGPGTCIYQLDPPPDIAQLMYPEVHEGGDDGGVGPVIPQDASHVSGWDFTDSSDTGIEIYGSLCDAIQAGSVTLRVTYYCNII
jgi:hypothetical protein